MQHDMLGVLFLPTENVMLCLLGLQLFLASGQVSCHANFPVLLHTLGQPEQ